MGKKEISRALFDVIFDFNKHYWIVGFCLYLLQVEAFKNYLYNSW